jgi:hypothetical protein
MSLTEGETAATYTGPLASIPASAPPGLRLLAALLAPLAALDPAAAHAAAARHCAPGARISHNGTAAAPVNQLAGDTTPQAAKLVRRAAALSRADRELDRAVEVALEGGEARELWWHGRTAHVFRADAEAAAEAGIEPEVVWMAEAGLWRVERVPAGLAGEDVGVAGWWVVEMASWHDRTAILRKRAELGA